MKAARAPTSLADRTATHSGENAHSGVHEESRSAPLDVPYEKIAIGSSWGRRSSSMRAFMSEGPSTSTKRGRTRSTVARTRRAQAGL